MRALATIVMLALGMASSMPGAQSTTGTLQGTVSAIGPDGQPFNIPGVSLKLSGTPLGSASLSTFSNSNGEYKFAELRAGSYTLEASFQGFKTVAKIVAIQAGETVVENIRMELEELHEQVTVTAEIEGIDTK